MAWNCRVHISSVLLGPFRYVILPFIVIMRSFWCMIFEVFTPANIRIMVWDVTLSFGRCQQCLRGSWFLNLHGTLPVLKMKASCSFVALLCIYQTRHHPKNYDVSIAVLGIQVWDVMLCHHVSEHCEGTFCLKHQATHNPVTQLHIR